MTCLTRGAILLFHPNVNKAIKMEKSHKFYVVTGVIDGAKEELYGSYAREDAVYEKEAEKESWKEQGYKKIKIEVTTKIEAPDPEVYGDDIASRFIIAAINDGCSIELRCDGEEIVEASESFEEVLKELEGIDDVVNALLYKNGDYLGTLAIIMGGMEKDETIIDYTVTKYIEGLYQELWAKY